MTVTTTYTCDKCKKEQTSPLQFWTIKVVVNTFETAHAFDTAWKSIQVCRSCLESLGIYAPKPKPEQPIPTFPTIEELIIDIIRNHTDGN